jgi:hypothetical protein
MIADMARYRITPRRRMFVVEAVTAAGAIELLATYATEEQAVEQLRLLQLARERLTLRRLAAEDGPKAQRGRFLGAAVVAASAD